METRFTEGGITSQHNRIAWRTLILLGLFALFHCGQKKETVHMNLIDTLEVEANIVFFYYEDLAGAQDFYESIIGLERVLDYGFASVHRVSPTSYVGLVDEKGGMHRASEPKTVTLAFVTEEVDGWYSYLESMGVPMRGPLRDATRHPTRGFVAYDPEGYFLEFETFLDHPQNTEFRSQLAGSDPLFRPEGMKTSRPADLGVQANVIWLYYEDIPAAQRFYEETFGLRLLVDQGFAKVYSSTPTCFIGLVDGAQGLHSFTEEKAVTIAFITDRVDDGYIALEKRGLRMRGQVADSDTHPIRAFVGYDVAGYFLEFDRFLEHPDNEVLLRLIGE